MNLSEITSMHVRIVLPSGVFHEQNVTKVVAEARNGSFCLLPRHIDFVTALVPGILTLTPVVDDSEREGKAEDIYLAIDEGLLVKRNSQVQISTWNAVRGSLGKLKEAVEAQFYALDEHEQKARQALEHLEASLVRQVLGREGRSHG
ncbi:MAG TPA: F0F1 ATP synthase subunit epsilon [Planctomicrobium sp.]|nr:F0F1 ATP synthase subunit epsilon [Planctomicrobium sp.]